MREFLMKRYFHFLTAMLLYLMTACTEDTGSMGFYPPNENIETSTATIWGIKTSSLAMDSVTFNFSRNKIRHKMRLETIGRFYLLFGKGNPMILSES